MLLLQANGKQTGRELATRLEVSERTVHRDMEALSAAGVPVFAVRGTRGGWQLEDTWRTQVPGLDEAELRALLMAQPRVIGDARLAAAAERAINKLMAALPVSMRARATEIRQRLYVDTTGWWGGTENLEALPVVQDAVTHDRKLTMKYRAAARPTDARSGQATRELVDRTVDPLGMVAKGANWYLVANTLAGFRTYRVSRIEQPVMLDEPSTRPPDFDLAAYWKSSTAEFLETRQRYHATLRLASDAAEKMKSWRMCSPVNAEDAPDANGWVAIHAQFEDEEQALFIVLGFGSRARVIEPETLRARVQAEFAAMSDVITATRSSRAADPESAGSSGVPVRTRERHAHRLSRA
jgi:predicted DNA-binding transcriptional regulator YafY